MMDPTLSPDLPTSGAGRSAGPKPGWTGKDVRSAPPSPPARLRPGSPLQRQAWLITAGVLAALAVVVLFGANWIFRRSYAQLELQSAGERAARVQQALAFEVDTLERSGRDYAEWNETYEFMTDSSRPFVANNMIESVFTNLRIQAFMLFDPAGRLYAGRTYAPDSGVSLQGLDELAPAFGAVARRAASGASVRGLMRLKDRLVFFASLPVMHDDGSGPPRGALTYVRVLDQDVIARLSRLVNLNIELRLAAAGGAGAPADPARGPAANFRTVAQDGAAMIIDTPLVLHDGGDAGSIRITFSRDIYQQGVKAGHGFITVVLIMVVAAGGLIGWLLRTRVIGRLEKLQAGVQRAEETANLEAHLPVEGNDEIADLARGINRMLAAFARSEGERQDALRQRELINSQLQQSQKMEAVGTLAGGLAHDFNNLLMAIMGSVGLLRLQTLTDPRSQEHLVRIEKAAMHAAEIIRQMLTFSRREPSSFRDVRLGEVTAEALKLLRAGLPRSIEFQYRNEAVDDFVNADPTQLHQVLYNLATNASHAMASGRGLLTVTITEVNLPDPRRGETAALAPGRYLCLIMSDTGCGIEPENLSRVFDPFFTTKPVGVGTGLGLAVVHGIVTAHRGSIGVESAVGQGTKFFIYLPRVDRPAPPASPAPAPVGGHLLVVDDDLLVRETLDIGLTRSGFRVTTATNGLDGVRLAEQLPDIDALITDQMMPGISGMELGERIAVLRPGLPVIIMSGFAPAVGSAAVRARGFELLAKPVLLDDLVGTLRRLLATRRPRAKDPAPARVSSSNPAVPGA
jgi:two-component system, cell cycle sensor histidine kinase and response regulator CckA